LIASSRKPTRETPGYIPLEYARTQNTSRVREARQVSIAFARALSIGEIELLFHATLRHNRVRATIVLPARYMLLCRAETLWNSVRVARAAICCSADREDRAECARLAGRHRIDAQRNSQPMCAAALQRVWEDIPWTELVPLRDANPLS
jgi:hypothetical protein